MGSRDLLFDTPKSLMQFASAVYPWLARMERRAAAELVAGSESAAEQAIAVHAIGTLEEFLAAHQQGVKEHVEREVRRRQLEAEIDYVNDGAGVDFGLYSDEALDREYAAIAVRTYQQIHQGKCFKYLEGYYERRRRRAGCILHRIGDALKQRLMRGMREPFYRVTAIVLPDPSRRELSIDDLAGTSVDLRGNALVSGAIRWEGVAISVTDAATASVAISDSTPTGQPGRRPHTGTGFILDRLDELVANSNQRTRLAGMTLTAIAQDLHDWYRSTRGNDGLPTVPTIKNRIRPVLRQAGLLTSLSRATSDRGSGTRPH